MLKILQPRLDRKSSSDLGGYTAQGYLDVSYQQSHLVQVVARDKLMELTIPVRINPGVPVFDWGEQDFAFHVPVTLADGSEAVSLNQLMALLTQLGIEKEVNI